MRQVTHALLTRPPLSQSSVRKLPIASFDLHVLGTPPAFILSQDQTLMLKFIPVQNLAWLVLNRSTVVFRFCSECSHSWPIPQAIFIRIFRVLHTVQFSRFFVVVSATARLCYHSCSFLSTTFLKFFSNRSRCLNGRSVFGSVVFWTRHILAPGSTKVNTFLQKFFQLF